MDPAFSFCLLSLSGLIGFQEAPKRKETFPPTLIYIRSCKTEELAKNLQKVFGPSMIIQPTTGTSVSGLLISGPPKEVELAVSLVEKLDKSPQIIPMELVLVETSGNVALSTESVEKWTADLKKTETEGKLLSLRRMDLVVLENKPTKITLGETRPMATSANVSRTGVAQRSFSYSNFGTTVTAKANLEKENLLLVDLSVEDSRAGQTPTPAPDKPEDFLPASMGQLRIEAMVRVAKGKIVKVQGIQDQAKTGHRQFMIFLIAK